MWKYDIIKVNVHGAFWPDQPKSNMNAQVNFLLFWSQSPVLNTKIQWGFSTNWKGKMLSKNQENVSQIWNIFRILENGKLNFNFFIQFALFLIFYHTLNEMVKLLWQKNNFIMTIFYDLHRKEEHSSLILKNVVKFSRRNFHEERRASQFFE